MFTKPRFRWLVSLTMGGLLLVLALMGGNWGTDYSAIASDTYPPLITYIDPPAVPAGSDTRVVIIGGDHFGDETDTSVRIEKLDFVDMMAPRDVITTGISLDIPDTLMVEPSIYQLTVFKSLKGTVPTEPLWDGIDLGSSPINFVVFDPIPLYLPIIKR